MLSPSYSRISTRRRCRFASCSCHTHRRALLRRLGLFDDIGRPAAVFDTVVRSLLAARAPLPVHVIAFR